MRKENNVPPLVLNCTVQGLPAGQNVSLSIWTKSLKDSVRLAWHAQLNCQRALSPAEGGVPQLGKVGKLALEASIVCLASFQHLLCRLISLQSNFQFYRSIGHLSR